jgi:hypothetical protein
MATPQRIKYHGQIYVLAAADRPEALCSIRDLLDPKDVGKLLGLLKAKGIAAKINKPNGTVDVPWSKMDKASTVLYASGLFKFSRGAGS